MALVLKMIKAYFFTFFNMGTQVSDNCHVFLKSDLQ